jgi:hypothetical protein
MKVRITAGSGFTRSRWIAIGDNITRYIYMERVEEQIIVRYSNM